MWNFFIAGRLRGLGGGGGGGAVGLGYRFATSHFFNSISQQDGLKNFHTLGFLLQKPYLSAYTQFTDVLI